MNNVAECAYSTRAEPKYRPILFSATMVRAILAGNKTQTRRVVKTSKTLGRDSILAPHLGKKHAAVYLLPEHADRAIACCPYGQPEDRLWVKETTVKVEDHGYVGPVYAESEEGRSIIEYGLSPSPDDVTEVEPHEIKLRPSLFMTRAMSRITLEITSVRVERLQDISEADSIAEGVTENGQIGPGGIYAANNPRGAYIALWHDINGPESWYANPWVWVVEFKRVEGGAP